jgi:hypothetical protein
MIGVFDSVSAWSFGGETAGGTIVVQSSTGAVLASDMTKGFLHVTHLARLPSNSRFTVNTVLQNGQATSTFMGAADFRGF